MIVTLPPTMPREAVQPESSATGALLEAAGLFWQASAGADTKPPSPGAAHVIVVQVPAAGRSSVVVHASPSAFPAQGATMYWSQVMTSRHERTGVESPRQMAPETQAQLEPVHRSLEQYASSPASAHDTTALASHSSTEMAPLSAKTRAEKNVMPSGRHTTTAGHVADEIRPRTARRRCIATMRSNQRAATEASPSTVGPY